MARLASFKKSSNPAQGNLPKYWVFAVPKSKILRHWQLEYAMIYIKKNVEDSYCIDRGSVPDILYGDGKDWLSWLATAMSHWFSRTNNCIYKYYISPGAQESQYGQLRVNHLLNVKCWIIICLNQFFHFYFLIQNFSFIIESIPL